MPAPHPPAGGPEGEPHHPARAAADAPTAGGPKGPPTGPQDETAPDRPAAVPPGGPAPAQPEHPAGEPADGAATGPSAAPSAGGAADPLAAALSADAAGPGSGPAGAPPAETAPPLLRDPVPPGLPQSVLFCCDHNAVRSPMAEGLMKRLYGTAVYVQSAGVKSDLDVDGFAVAVCRELGVELARHRVRSFEQMKHLGDDLSAFDLIVALSPASLRQALDLTRLYHLRVEYWPVLDPTGLGETREEKLSAYRQTRDQLHSRMLRRFGPQQPATP